MVETADLAPPPPRVRWRRWLAAVLVLLLVGAGVFWFWPRERGGPRLRFVNPAAGASVRAGPMPVDVAPELAAEGLKAEYLGQSNQVDQVFVFRRESYALMVEITAGQQPVAPGELRYALIDGTGGTVGEGKVGLAANLQPGAKSQAIVNDSELPKAQRVLIRK